MEAYQRTIFAIVRGSFVTVPVLAILFLIAGAFDHQPRGNEIGAGAVIITIGIAGFFFTGLIQRIIIGARP